MRNRGQDKGRGIEEGQQGKREGRKSRKVGGRKGELGRGRLRATKLPPQNHTLGQKVIVSRRGRPDTASLFLGHPPSGFTSYLLGRSFSVSFTCSLSFALLEC